MARAWAEPLERREEMLLAAQQHDVGWTSWEQRPTFNPQTGLPHSFLELETRAHLQIWSGAARLVEPACALAALLVSRHGTGLYERYHGDDDPASVKPLVRKYLSSERSMQEAMLAKVRSLPTGGAPIDEAWLNRASALIAAWDWLSLIVCMNDVQRASLRDVPWDDRRLGIEAMREDEARWRISPWVFAGRDLKVVTEGRLMPSPARDEATMRSMLNAAEIVRLEIVLVSG